MEGPWWAGAKRGTVFGLLSGFPLTATLSPVVGILDLRSTAFWMVCGAFPILFGVAGAVIGYLDGEKSPDP